MNVLVACEESQRVCAAFRAKGHSAYSCDIINASGGAPEWHIKQDVQPLLNGNCTFTTCDGAQHFIQKWDLIIAFPPCTYFSVAGARWLYKDGVVNEERYNKGLEMKKLFMAIYNADCEKIAIENPTPLKIWELPKETQIVQPYMFGEPFKKRTLLWLKGLPALQPTNMVDDYISWVNSSSAKEHGERSHRAKERSKTFIGLAQAMADQWG